MICTGLKGTPHSRMPAKQFQLSKARVNDLLQHTRAPEVSAGIRGVPTLLPPSWDGQQGLVAGAPQGPAWGYTPASHQPRPQLWQEMLDTRLDPGGCWRPWSQ